jgi:Bacterial protein of unknown function (DUF937)
MDLISVASQYLTPPLVAKIASVTGLDRAIVQKAITAAIPALFAGLVNTASKPNGAERLFDAVTQHPAGDISTLENASELNQSQLASGSDLLSSLFGGSTFNGLKQALGSFAGVGEGKAGTLLASLAPAVLGTLGQAQRKSGLDASGLSSLLMSQREDIVDSLPPGLASMLPAGMTDSLKRSTERVFARAENVSRMAPEQARYAAKEARATSSNWVYWALPLLALAGLAWWFMAQPNETQTVQTMAPAAETAGRAATAVPPLPDLPSISGLTAGGVPVGQNVTNVVDTVRSALSGVTDEASARAAMPRLASAEKMLDDTQAAAGQLPAEGKTTLASYIRAASPVLKDQFDKVLALPGVGGVLKPIADSVIGKIDRIASA